MNRSQRRTRAIGRRGRDVVLPTDAYLARRWGWTEDAVRAVVEEWSAARGANRVVRRDPTPEREAALNDRWMTAALAGDPMAMFVVRDIASKLP